MISDSDKEKLLEPGRAGQLNGEELAYIRAEIIGNKELAREWGFRNRSQVSNAEIKRVAMDGVVAGSEKRHPLDRGARVKKRRVAAIVR